MVIANLYRNWKIVHLLNKIPLLITKGRFEYADKFLQEATAIFETLPDEIKKNKSQTEDLIINMRALLGSEFRKKLELELDKDDFSIAGKRSERRSLLRVLRHTLRGKKQESAKLVHQKIVAKKQKKSVFKQALPASKTKVVKKDENLKIAKSKLQEWKRKGYDTSLLEKQFSHSASQGSQRLVQAKKTLEISKPNEKVFELQNKISDWKKQGFNTAVLEKQLSILVKK